MSQIKTELLRKDAPIGVFDSGVGGLTVVREIMRQIPNEKIIYFGDTARVPYGSKSKDTVTRFSEQIVRFLILPAPMHWMNWKKTPISLSWEC